MLKSLIAGAVAFCVCLVLFVGGIMVGVNAGKSYINKVAMAATGLGWECHKSNVEKDVCIAMSQSK